LKYPVNIGYFAANPFATASWSGFESLNVIQAVRRPAVSGDVAGVLQINNMELRD
jgi:hypothetical protein